MRWNPEQRRRARHPVVGDTRVRRRFAWKPTLLTNGQKVWLERYEVSEVFSLSASRFGFAPRWTVVESVHLVVGL